MKKFKIVKLSIIFWLIFSLTFYPYLVHQSKAGMDRVMFLQVINFAVSYLFFAITIFFFTRDLIKYKFEKSNLNIKYTAVIFIFSVIIPLIPFLDLALIIFGLQKSYMCSTFEASTLLVKGYCVYYSGVIPNVAVSMLLIFLVISFLGLKFAKIK
ncbi:hypothetical protein [Paracidovorax valerianellae]|uniref:hypothetical protein n=2 Tax=Paracidovorax valerianellae TaxID=187868 RepID=UPI00111430A7|nr:hypothetical protein [Paracidovorax valerianellae]